MTLPAPLPSEFAEPLAHAADRLGPFAGQVVWYQDVASTNDLAAGLAEQGAREGCIVLANAQSAGRGRQGRTWASPAGAGLYVSIVLTPPPHAVPLLTIAAGVAVAEGIRSASGLEPRLKWPNDVQIRRHKVAGILTESRTESNRIAEAVVGIGINVHQEIDTFPPELRDIATSLCIEGCRVERSILLQEILNRMEDVFALEPATILKRWEERATGWGEPVRVETGDETFIGKMVRLTETGALVLDRSDGSERTIHAGDVHRLRKA